MEIDSALGRFAQADTLIPQPSDPQAWDRYADVENNPLRYTDPSGHDICDEDGNCYERGYVNYRKINGQDNRINGFLFPFNYHRSDISGFLHDIAMITGSNMPRSRSGPVIRGISNVKGKLISEHFSAEPARLMVPDYNTLPSSGPVTIFDALGLAETLGPLSVIPMEDDSEFGFTPHYISYRFDLLSPVGMRIEEMYVETQSSSVRVMSIKVSDFFTEEFVPVPGGYLPSNQRVYFDTSMLPQYSKNRSLEIILTARCVLCVNTGNGPADRYITVTLKYPGGKQ